MSMTMNLKRFVLNNNIQNRILLSSISNYSNVASNFLIYDKDPSKQFFNQETQKLLRSMTQLHLDKVFRRRNVQKNTVEFKFLTDKQLEQEVRSKFQDAEKLLQMPPILQLLDDKPKTISEDPGIKGFATSKIVFTDVTYGMKNSDRFIVIRYPDGTLKQAPFEVRKRIYQTYFPMDGRTFEEPNLFNEENMKRLLEESQYEMILDSCCLYFEPFEPRYHQITSQVYNFINEQEAFNALRSTRHFGPMAFYLSWHKIIDKLLLDMIRSDYLRNAVELICLMYKLNAIPDDISILKNFDKNESEKQIRSTLNLLLSKSQPEIKQIDKSSEDLKLDEICFEFIQNYAKNHSPNKGHLERALQTYKERHNELKSIAEGVN